MTQTRRRLSALAAALATASAALVGVAASAAGPAAAAAHRTSGGSTATALRYAVIEPACPRPGPLQAGCFALRRVLVPHGTPGAQAVAAPRPDVLHGPSGGLSPHALVSAYGLDLTRGRGQTVAVVDWHDDPNARTDLNHFDRHYGIPAESSTSFVKVNQWGRRSNYPVQRRDTSTEIALDIEAVRSVCRHCRILLVEARNASLDNLAIAVNTAARLGADEISNSYGAPESRGNPVPSSLVRAYDHPGRVITVSTGDRGWFGWDPENAGAQPERGPQYPATNPSVVAVGGTRLDLRADGTVQHETVWDSNGPADRDGWAQGYPLGATGGGCSYQFAAPSWQHQRRDYVAAGCHGRRLAADVSADADPATGLDVYNTYGHNGWEVIGGTSLSAPLVAGMWALAGGARGMSDPARALYQHYLYDRSALHDVRVGGSGFCGGISTSRCETMVRSMSQGTNRPGTNNPSYFFDVVADCSFPNLHKVVGERPRDRECNAASGYDGPSGVGSPRKTRVFRSTTPDAAITFSGRLVRGQAKQFAARLHDPLPGAHGTTWVWSWGDNTNRTTTHGYRASHTYRSYGQHKITVRITDSAGQHIVRTRVVTAHHS